jgi:hypothetical protein
MMSTSLAAKIGTMKHDGEVVKSFPTPATYFDNASCTSHSNGVVEVTLTGIVPNETGGAPTLASAVTHLKCSVLTAMALRNSIEKAILTAKIVRNSETLTDQWVSDLAEV